MVNTNVLFNVLYKTIWHFPWISQKIPNILFELIQLLNQCLSCSNLLDIFGDLVLLLLKAAYMLFWLLGQLKNIAECWLKLMARLLSVIALLIPQALLKNAPSTCAQIMAIQTFWKRCRKITKCICFLCGWTTQQTA